MHKEKPDVSNLNVPSCNCPAGQIFPCALPTVETANKHPWMVNPFKIYHKPNIVFIQSLALMLLRLLTLVTPVACTSSKTATLLLGFRQSQKCTAPSSPPAATVEAHTLTQLSSSPLTQYLKPSNASTTLSSTCDTNLANPSFHSCPVPRRTPSHQGTTVKDTATRWRIPTASKNCL